VSAPPVAHDTTAPDGGATAAGAEALSGVEGAGAPATAERLTSLAVGPEGAHDGGEGAQAATPALKGDRAAAARQRRGSGRDGRRRGLTEGCACCGAVRRRRAPG
jgi:hypothetical protein